MDNSTNLSPHSQSMDESIKSVKSTEYENDDEYKFLKHKEHCLESPLEINLRTVINSTHSEELYGKLKILPQDQLVNLLFNVQKHINPKILDHDFTTLSDENIKNIKQSISHNIDKVKAKYD